MTNKQTAQDKIAGLVTRFEEQYQSYKNSDYNETLTRRDFIDPFFKALGWDIDNEAGYAEAYREVIHEDKVKVSGATKVPDYSFRLVGGKRLFFVEAKKPSVSVKDDIQPAYQVRRYGWSAKLPISIITDFEEFSIYDCTKKPKPNDKPAVARIKYLSFRDYIKEFDFLWDTFSKEQVLKGSFDKFLLSDTHKKGTATVDKDFLESLDRWRTYLAVNLSWNNRTLDEDEINFVVQQTIDRIIFLRIAEDRSVEAYGTLKNAVKQGNLYQNLFELFQRADEKYNSGLFDFKKDKISRNVVIENKIIRTIINELYYPECPYEFSVLSVEILGSAYEQFLGKVIRITPAHHAKIEEKPEVRKAGGVYYTPQYIVDYIVKNTIGKLIEGKTPKEISKIKILDPACGSGSFLIGAFQYLLDYHKDFYSENGKPSKGKKDNPLTPDGHLTTAEKKRILLNNIFGVDLDTNAVEVSKLSLLIKCLEGETEASINQQFKLFNERVLPSLDNNIKEGNSLVDTDFFDNQIDFGEDRRIKPFQWQENFPLIFKEGGFDIVIGNPPYVFGRDWKSLGISDDLKKYFGEHYKSSPYQLDFFSIFMEKGIRLLNRRGINSFIVPNVWLTNTYSSKTRNFLLGNASNFKIIVPVNKVFEGLTVDTAIYILEKGERQSKTFTISNLSIAEESKVSDLNFLDYINGDKPISTSLTEGGNSLIEKIANNSTPLGEIADITRGVHPYRLGGYGKSAFSQGPQNQRDLDERPYHSPTKKNSYRPFIYGKDLKYFTILAPREYIKYGHWLAEPRDKKFFEDERIYSRKILGKTLIVTVEKNDSIADQQVYITKPRKSDIRINYLAAVMGSKLISFYIRNYFDEVNDAFPQIKVGQLKALPIKIAEISVQKSISDLIDHLLILNSEKENINLPSRLTQHQSKIEYCESKINNLVNSVYGLTEGEIEIIENK